jgi:hypothetical protein
MTKSARGDELKVSQCQIRFRVQRLRIFNFEIGFDIRILKLGFQDSYKAFWIMVTRRAFGTAPTI